MCNSFLLSTSLEIISRVLVGPRETPDAPAPVVSGMAAMAALAGKINVGAASLG